MPGAESPQSEGQRVPDPPSVPVRARPDTPSGGQDRVPKGLARAGALAFGASAMAVGICIAFDALGLRATLGKWLSYLVQALLIGGAILPLLARFAKSEAVLNHPPAAGTDTLVGEVLAHAPMMIWSAGPDGERSFFNARWLSFRGRSLEEDRGHAWMSGIHPDDRAAFEREAQMELSARRGFSLEYRLLRSNGEFAWVQDRAVPLVGPGGEFLGYFGAVLEVTEQKETEACLQEALAELRDMNTALNEACIVSTTDSKGRITYVNPQFEKISGYSKTEVIGQDHRVLNSGYHARTMWTEMYRTILSGGAWKSVIRNREKNGGYYWVASTMKGLFGADGALKKIISIRTDVTELKSLAEELRQARDAAQAADRAKSEFLANMSHEIRTPMTAILGFTELLLEEGDITQAPAARVRLISDIRRNGEHLLSVINDILDLSKIEAGGLEAHWVDCSPVGIMEDAAAMLRQSAQVKGLSLNVEVNGEVPALIHTDPLRTRQILLNLLGNAIKFTEHGSVTTRVTTTVEPKPSVVFEVIDSGIGISEEQGRRLFQPFVQVDASHTRQFGGTGLGLTISRRLAGILHGTLHYTSSAGKGTTFVLTLPIGKIQGGAARETAPDHVPVSRIPATAPSSADVSLVGRRILLAEDGPDNRRIVIHFLTKAGATVEAVENGRAAIDKAMAARDAGKPFDVVLMDVQMPVLDGLGATRSLRSTGYSGTIIALTAHAMPSDRNECLDAGCDEYLTKPIDRKLLISTCARWAQRDKATRAA